MVAQLAPMAIKEERCVSVRHVRFPLCVGCWLVEFVAIGWSIISAAPLRGGGPLRWVEVGVEVEVWIGLELTLTNLMRGNEEKEGQKKARPLQVLRDRESNSGLPSIPWTYTRKGEGPRSVRHIRFIPLVRAGASIAHSRVPRARSKKIIEKMQGVQRFGHRESNSGLPPIRDARKTRKRGHVPYAMSESYPWFARGPVLAFPFKTPRVELGSALHLIGRKSPRGEGLHSCYIKSQRLSVTGGRGPNERDLGSSSKNVQARQLLIGHRESNSGLPSTSFEGSRHKEKDLRSVGHAGSELLVGWLYGIAGTCRWYAREFRARRGDLHRIDQERTEKVPLPGIKQAPERRNELELEKSIKKIDCKAYSDTESRTRVCPVW
ncbi:hypothetical protein B0H14DRAFT_2644466 [Mycena olivaceomarginata]|nr:hypothetical protein B0H14DRAFT_2644466 [Mycena olivaceomarginata]